MVLRLIKEVLRGGEATIPYPYVSIEVAPGFRGKPQHDPRLCISCGACGIACPSNAITMETDLDQDKQTWSIFYGRCIYCARCEEVCPVGAIQLGQDFELAVMNKADLYERADYRLTICQRCGMGFAAEKEIAYVLALLEQAGLPAKTLEDYRPLLHLCPTCRRKLDAGKVMYLYQEVAE